jgi:exodeoxyribonuclease VII large subunit
VQRPDGAVVRDPDEVRTGDRLRVRVAGGELTAEALPG